MTTEKTELQQIVWTLFNGSKLVAWVENAAEATAAINAANAAIYSDAYTKGKADGTIDPRAAITVNLYGAAKRVINFATIAERDVVLAVLGGSASAAQRVEIVSMPDRETTLEITRDSSNNIKSTKQTERDA